MKKIDWSKVGTAPKTTELTPGGYACSIVNAVDNPKKEYVTIEFDIAEGDFAGYFTKVEAKTGWWLASGQAIRSYKESAQPYFKMFLDAVEESNPGFKFDDKERELLGKKVGVVLGIEEYMSKQGEQKEKLYAYAFVSVDKIRTGNYTVPEKKKLKSKEAAPAAAISNPYENPVKPDISDDDLPF